MKKRSSLIFMVLSCMALVFGAVMLEGADAAAAEETEEEYTARIVYDDYYDGCTYDGEYCHYYDGVARHEIENGDTIKAVGYTGQYSGESLNEYFMVVATKGSNLTYKEGNVEVSVEPDETDEPVLASCDIYRFKLPKREKKITVTFDADPSKKIELTVTANKPVTTYAEKVDVVCKSARYVPDAGGDYKYGNIVVETEGVSSAGSFTAYVPDIRGEYNGYNTSDGWGAITTYFDFARLKEPTTDEEKKSDAERMNAFISPLLKEGATIVVEPGVKYNDRLNWKGNRTDNCSYTHTEKDVYYKYTNSGTNLSVTKTIDTTKYTFKARKVKIPKLRNAPKVKVDAVKGTIKLNAKMEYRYKTYVDGKLGEFGDWTDGVPRMSINDVSTASITCGGIIEVRNKATARALYSKTTSITLPAQKAIDITKIVADGTATKGSIKASGYEYTTEDPKNGGAKWVKIKEKGLNFTVKKPAGGTYYIRKMGVNAKGSTEFEMPSEIAVFTVSGSSLKVTTDGSGSYISTMSALY